MIRKLKPEELSLTIAVASHFFQESKLPGELNLSHWLKTWRGLIYSGIGAIFAYFPKADSVEVGGILGGLFYPCSMTGQLEALEGFWYVEPDYRGGTGGIKLLKAFEEEGKARGCARVKMVHLSSLNPELVANIYERMGYHKLQVNYSKEL